MRSRTSRSECDRARATQCSAPCPARIFAHTSSGAYASSSLATAASPGSVTQANASRAALRSSGSHIGPPEIP